VYLHEHFAWHPLGVCWLAVWLLHSRSLQYKFGTGTFPGCRNGPGVMHAIALTVMRGKSSKNLDPFRGVERNPKTTATSTSQRKAAKPAFVTPGE